MPASVKSASSSSISPSQATVLIATDVFGHTPAVSGLVRQLSVNAIVVTPWDDPENHFYSEQDAYQAFIVEGGVSRYAEKLKSILQEQTSLKFAIGFSAGASALWINSEHRCMQQLQNTVLFYGSRIREYRNIQPICPVRLIFAEHEAAFTPRELVSDLQQRGHQAEIAKATKHGFMNSYSRGCCVKSQTRYTSELLTMLHTTLNQAAA
ncbi:hypothetical protein H8K32_02675 [Undibacterium jejuense]|uniref:Dienelactone hydrolase domain-containing protein n=1 Tax=Undibacterium jejuense TaxID=1344949 RepID=A0A923HJT9_9BURK|nr:hypothetical protein [Undibacterium jejuense]MBC3860991.1 hypothetical protein [Undibacterium jejuense]